MDGNTDGRTGEEPEVRAGGPGSGGPLRSYDVRERNEKLILRLIQDRQEISQSEVVNETGLRAPTVFRIFSNLAERGFITESTTPREGPDRRGRRPSYYRISATAGYAIGVDLWAGSVAATVVDFTRETVNRVFEEIEPERPADAVIERLVELIRGMLREANIDRERLLGIGVGAPGIVDVARGEIVSYSRIPGMERVPLAERLSDAFSLPVVVHNNTSVIAASEYRYGRAQYAHSVMAILIRSGVGGALLQHGQPFTNNGHSAMEVGHTIVDPSARLHGRPGTLESMVSEGALFSRLEAECGTSERSVLLERLESGDRAAVEALREPVDAIGASIVTLANLFNPEVFLIISRHAVLSAFLATGASRYAEHDLHGTRLKAGEVIPCEYDPLLACRGASDLVFDRYFSAGND